MVCAKVLGEKIVPAFCAAYWLGSVALQKITAVFCGGLQNWKKSDKIFSACGQTSFHCNSEDIRIANNSALVDGKMELSEVGVALSNMDELEITANAFDETRALRCVCSR